MLKTLNKILQNSEEDKVSLKLQDLAPNFRAKVQYSDKIEEVDLYDFLEKAKAKWVLLVFYPGDDTPGCTSQLCKIRDIYKEYQDLDVTIFGVNPASSESHQKFINKYTYPFGIIVDENKEIRQKYGATKYFFKNLTTKRGVFLINSDKKITFIHWGQQNNQEILDLIKSLNNIS
jgi:thioredoxin-dependent peroxiredoxin